MEITNENFFKIKYNEKKDKLEIHKENGIIMFLKRYKFLNLMLTLFIIFSCINIFLIYSFVKNLEMCKIIF